MGVVMFYQLTRHSMDDAVDMLVPRAVSQGWRVMIRSPDRAALDRQDARLWLEPEDDFLAHGLEGGSQDAEQPVLLGSGPARNGARAVLLMGAQAVDPEEARQLDRVWLVFDGRDAPEVQAARGAWKSVVAAGLTAQYWNDESGRWEKKAESGASG